MPLSTYIVEDNATTREQLVGTLEELAGVCVVASAATLEEGEAWLARYGGQCDVVIVDLFLRNGSGLQLVQQLARRRPEQKVVVFSNYVNPEMRRRCAQLGADAVFDKSTEIDGLVDYCARLAALKAQERPSELAAAPR